MHRLTVGVALALGFLGRPATGTERQLTYAPYGHVLTNVNVWSPDSRWIV
jgi:hypothetical protein